MSAENYHSAQHKPGTNISRKQNSHWKIRLPVVEYYYGEGGEPYGNPAYPGL